MSVRFARPPIPNSLTSTASATPRESRSGGTRWRSQTGSEIVRPTLLWNEADDLGLAKVRTATFPSQKTGTNWRLCADAASATAAVGDDSAARSSRASAISHAMARPASVSGTTASRPCCPAAMRRSQFAVQVTTLPATSFAEHATPPCRGLRDQPPRADGIHRLFGADKRQSSPVTALTGFQAAVTFSCGALGNPHS
jgi:hypothetical protein